MSPTGEAAGSELATSSTFSRLAQRIHAAWNDSRQFGPVFWLAVFWLALVVVGALSADILPLADPAGIDFTPGLGPSGDNWLGTDALGRDILARIVFGSRVSLIVGIGSTFCGLVVGGLLGLLAGFKRGTFDLVASGLINILMSIPGLLLALILVAFLGASLENVTLALSILAIPTFARLVRGATLSYSNRDFVLAARITGATDGMILRREIVGNVLPVALSYALVSTALAIVAEGSLSFLGLSVPPPTPTWGGMIAEGLQVLTNDPLLAAWPALCMFLTILSLNLVGDTLRQHVDTGGRS